ncbi:MAG: acetolactate decarboxylase [Cytophagales bacterium]|jgi:acetolactate decarboxylase|nr:acetolactate decarboxylase [Cytophagales bacterium]
MHRLFFILVLLCSKTVHAQLPEVQVVGAMKNIMRMGNFAPHVLLDTVAKKHLYGLGPVAGLKGELMIWNGQVMTSAVQNSQLRNDSTQVKAAMMVYSYVSKWKTVTLHPSVKNYADLEKWIEMQAQRMGYSLSEPFPFLIEGTLQQVKYHVIDWQPGTAHTMENHKQFAYNGVFANKPVRLLGFYSDRHHSVFTHHATNMHIHVADIATQTVGHLEDIQFNAEIKLHLPEK